MDKKNLAAGIKEMRSVAKRLMAWADDLEKSAVSAEPEPVVAADAAPAVAPAAPPPTLAEVKAFLTGRCAAGYSAQVKALIASFGASSLSSVPEESLGDLMEAARMLGEGEGDAG